MAEARTSRQHLELHTMQAAKAFARHVITKRCDDQRRYLLQKLYEDGRPDWTFAAEVIVLEGGGLYVGGDIDHVVFAHGPAAPIARLRWLGECDDLGYYVRQKAQIGSRRNSCVDDWDSAIACTELRQYVAQLRDEEEASSSDINDTFVELALNADSRERFLEYAGQAFPGFPDSWESVGSMGEVLGSAVIYAHAALARLCALLREEEAALKQEAVHG